MKLCDFDFRIWDNGKYHYPIGINNDILTINLSIGINDEMELFTGFYDKNGKKIYEGDILFSFEGCSEGEAFKYKAVLKEGAFYLVEYGDNGKEYDEDLISEFHLEELEIMGNIHENENLLRCVECEEVV